MPSNRVALITGANQGVGFQVANELVANGLTVLVGSRAWLGRSQGDGAWGNRGPARCDGSRFDCCRGGAHP
jgi:NAD(P)-dependent dehydrogenase (short-subunit alcohol dehydrogenase family)